jgi:hypothetical protein
VLVTLFGFARRVRHDRFVKGGARSSSPLVYLLAIGFIHGVKWVFAIGVKCLLHVAQQFHLSYVWLEVIDFADPDLLVIIKTSSREQLGISG